MAQREIPALSNHEKPELVPAAEIEQCETLTDAIALCVQRSRYRKHYQIAELMAMTPAHFSRVLSGSHHLPDDKLVELQEVCGNLAPTQFLMRYFGFEVPGSERERKIEELEQQLEKLKKAG